MIDLTTCYNTHTCIKVDVFVNHKNKKIISAYMLTVGNLQGYYMNYDIISLPMPQRPTYLTLTLRYRNNASLEQVRPL